MTYLADMTPPIYGTPITVSRGMMITGYLWELWGL